MNLQGFMWSHLESNQAPTDYESVEKLFQFFAFAFI
jgi:hypothetical protein